MDTIALSEAPAHIGKNVRFVVAVQHILTGKRLLVSGQRVQSCHILHVGDASRQFFKITCWGDAPPTLNHPMSSNETLDLLRLSNSNAVLKIGDIVLFSSCCIKAFRGNVEAYFCSRNDNAATSSTVQLLYRKDRYYSTQEISLQGLYPMIEWYKQYCREFCAEEGIITSKAARKRRKRAKIKDLRENMVVSVLCKLRKMNDIASTNKGRGSGTLSDLDGVLLKELVMFDSVGEGMIVNLWDQHAEKRFVTRLLEHRGAVEINGVVISLQALSNRLVANTTPHTTFNLFDLDDPESIEIEKRVATNFRVRPSFTVATSPAVFYTLEELLNSSVVGLATLKNIRVEQICLDRNLGKQALVLAKFTPRLAEKFCTRCNQTLPERLCHDSMDPPHYEACTNRCKIRRGSETNALCAWRYRRFSMTLRDSKNERLSVEVDNQATAEIVGNIEARHLVEGQCDASPSCQFDPTSAVASLLNALAEDVDQTFEAQLMCSSANESHEASQTFGSTHDSSHGEAVVLQRVFSLLSFAPGDAIVL